MLISAAAAARKSRALSAKKSSVLFLEVIAGDAVGYARAHVAGARAWPNGLSPLVAPLNDVRACSVAQHALLGHAVPSTVIVYDVGGVGAYAAPRAAWWLLARGVNARVVDGGWPALLHERAQLAASDDDRQDADMDDSSGDVARVEAGMRKSRLLVTSADILKDISLPPSSRRLQLLDVRSPAEFSGVDYLARGNARGGHLPGAILMPHTDLFSKNGPGLLPRATLRELFEKAGLDPRRRVVAICQSGARAGAGFAALRAAGFYKTMLYEGAMREWLTQPNLPIEKG